MKNKQVDVSRSLVSTWGMALAACVIVTFLIALAAARHASSQDYSMSSVHAKQEGMVMPMDDKEGSEFNHHLAGVFMILAGFLLLSEDSFPRRWSFLRFAWPVCFLISGVFLLAYSDKELWPFGLQSWWYGLTHSLEVLQHKAFALILLAIRLETISGFACLNPYVKQSMRVNAWSETVEAMRPQ
jgi:hypothetical protein